MKKILLGALLAIVIGIVGMFSVGGNVFSQSHYVEIDEKKTLKANQIKELEINGDVVDVHISESKSDEIDIHFYGDVGERLKDQIQFEVEEKASKVEITVDQKNKWFVQIPFIYDEINSERKLDISIPAKLLKTLDVKSDIGNISIEDVQPSNLIARSDTGEIDVQNFAGKGQFTSDIGDISLENISGKVKATTDTGEVELQLMNLSDDIELNSEVGDIKVVVRGEAKNLSLNLNSEIGDVTVAGFDGFQNNSSNSVITNIGAGGPIIKAKTDVGEIEVVKQ